MVTGEGWPFLGLARDQWLCWGERYRRHLAETPRFNQSLLLKNYPPGTHILAIGRSFFAELVLSMALQDDGGLTGAPGYEIWIIDPPTNSYLIHIKSTDVTLIMASNDVNLGTWPSEEECCPGRDNYLGLWGEEDPKGVPKPKNAACTREKLDQCWHFQVLARLLRRLEFVPDAVVVGRVNWEHGAVHDDRVAYVACRVVVGVVCVTV